MLEKLHLRLFAQRRNAERNKVKGNVRLSEGWVFEATYLQIKQCLICSRVKSRNSKSRSENAADGAAFCHPQLSAINFLLIKICL